MARKRNPLKLNALQLKTLTILQALSEPDDSTDVTESDRSIPMLPSPHGNHFHIGSFIVMGRDATGLYNPSVWVALIRKGLVSGAPPAAARLTAAGVEYETDLSNKILHSHDH
jgi:hypothetical protein